MEPVWQIIIRGERAVSAARLGPSGEVVRRFERLWTIRDLCRRAGKSRRQVYRDMRAGKIRALGKFLGEWVLAPSALAGLNPPPGSIASLLPEYDLAALDPEEDRDLFLARILRFGGRERLRWAFSFYGAATVKGFVRERGARALDARSLSFWRLYFRLPRTPVPASVEKGRRWGGG